MAMERVMAAFAGLMSFQPKRNTDTLSGKMQQQEALAHADPHKNDRLERAGHRRRGGHRHGGGARFTASRSWTSYRSARASRRNRGYDQSLAALRSPAPRRRDHWYQQADGSDGLRDAIR